MERSSDALNCDADCLFLQTPAHFMNAVSEDLAEPVANAQKMGVHSWAAWLYCTFLLSAFLCSQTVRISPVRTGGRKADIVCAWLVCRRDGLGRAPEYGCCPHALGLPGSVS